MHARHFTWGVASFKTFIILLLSPTDCVAQNNRDQKSKTKVLAGPHSPRNPWEGSRLCFQGFPVGPLQLRPSVSASIITCCSPCETVSPFSTRTQSSWVKRPLYSRDGTQNHALDAILYHPQQSHLVGNPALGLSLFLLYPRKPETQGWKDPA